MSETPLAWFNLAHAYLHDAATLNAAPKPKVGHYEAPVRFVYVHAIELFLKAYLRLHGLDDATLASRRYSHHLDRLANEAEKRGLLISRRVRRICNAAADLDDPITARYIKTGARRVIPANRLHEAARDLQTRVETALRDAGIAMRQLPELPVVHPPRLSVAQALKRLARA